MAKTSGSRADVAMTPSRRLVGGTVAVDTIDQTKASVAAVPVASGREGRAGLDFTSTLPPPPSIAVHRCPADTSPRSRPPSASAGFPGDRVNVTHTTRRWRMVDCVQCYQRRPDGPCDDQPRVLQPEREPAQHADSARAHPINANRDANPRGERRAGLSPHPDGPHRHDCTGLEHDFVFETKLCKDIDRVTSAREAATTTHGSSWTMVMGTGWDGNRAGRCGVSPPFSLTGTASRCTPTSPRPGVHGQLVERHGSGAANPAQEIAELGLSLSTTIGAARSRSRPRCIPTPCTMTTSRRSNCARGSYVQRTSYVFNGGAAKV